MRSSVYGLLAWLAVSPALADDTVQRLEAELTAAPSATQFLTDKCAALHLATPAVIKAARAPDQRPASADIRKLLDVDADTVLGYRRVKLACGTHVLSDADNWYVPARLTPEMNHTLDTSDTSFGTVVKPLNFHRQTLKMEAADDPGHIFHVTALLIAEGGKPFSLVVENYSRELIAGH
jgi:hypothetical protein